MRVGTIKSAKRLNQPTRSQEWVFCCSLKIGVKFRTVERRSPKPNEAGSIPVTPARFASEDEVDSRAVAQSAEQGPHKA